jgi:hypothetical protein
VGEGGKGWVVIRSGGLGAYVRSKERVGEWVEAFWTEKDGEKIVDVTGECSTACVRGGMHLTAS